MRTTSGLSRHTTVAITSPIRRPACWVSRAASALPAPQQLADLAARGGREAQLGELGGHRPAAGHRGQAALHAALAQGLGARRDPHVADVAGAAVRAGVGAGRR